MVDEFMDYKTVPLFEFTLENEKEALGFIISGAPILITEKDP
jgi:hypothetical protein